MRAFQGWYFVFMLFICLFDVCHAGRIPLHVVLGEERSQYPDDHHAVSVHFCCHGRATVQRQVSRV